MTDPLPPVPDERLREILEAAKVLAATSDRYLHIDPDTLRSIVEELMRWRDPEHMEGSRGECE